MARDQDKKVDPRRRVRLLALLLLDGLAEASGVDADLPRSER